MSAEVESHDHAIKMFNRYTYNLFKGAVKLVDYKVPRGSSLAIAKCSARLIFDTVEDFEAWIKDSVIPATEAPTTEHQHQWTEKEWTETIEHPGEEIFGCECDDCGFWCEDGATMWAHQDETGHNGYSNYARSTEPTTETITHHKRVCSCGAEEVID